jgi:hypothetical protein
VRLLFYLETILRVILTPMTRAATPSQSCRVATWISVKACLVHSRHLQPWGWPPVETVLQAPDVLHAFMQVKVLTNAPQVEPSYSVPLPPPQALAQVAPLPQSPAEEVWTVRRSSQS